MLYLTPALAKSSDVCILLDLFIVITVEKSFAYAAVTSTSWVKVFLFSVIKFRPALAGFRWNAQWLLFLRSKKKKVYLVCVSLVHVPLMLSSFTGSREVCE